uniref:TonB-dependent receptor n=2 Tax=Sphingomonas sp. GlSt437 TaxID=3389970 RepID=UPI003A8ADBF6
MMAMLLAGVAMPAYAQERKPPQGDNSGVPDIVVTAERRETNQQTTPIAITALNAEALRANGVAVINDLAATVPNLTSTTGPQGSSDANFFIRGVGQFDFIVTNDPGVGVYVDGIYIGRTVGAMLDSGDIGRVEVLRGPQGTLFGRNTLGGAISVTSKAPDPSAFHVEGNATYGSRNRFEVDGAVNVPLGDDNALRLYGFYRAQDGFAKRAYDDVRFGATDRHGLRAALRLNPLSNVKVDIAADYSLDKSNPAPSVLRAIAPAPFFPAAAANDIQDPNNFYNVYGSNSPTANNRVWGVSGTIAVDLGGATLKSITAYRELKGFSTSDPDGTRFRLYDQLVDTNQSQFSQELQISGSLARDRLNYLLGGYFFRERAVQQLRLCFAPISNSTNVPNGPCNTWTQGNNQLTQSYAIFGQARYKFTNHLSLTLGGRYTWDTKDIISNQFFDFRPDAVGPGAVFGFGLPVALLGQRIVVPIVTNLPASRSFDQFTPKVGVEYQAGRTLLFASYTKGFRSGGFNGRLIAPQATVPSYNPDTNDAYELGFKTDLLDRHLRVNGTGFYQKYKGIQQTIADPAVQFRVANAGNAELYGFELEVTAAPTSRLNLNAALGYTHSKFVDVPLSVGPINGNKLPFSPEWTLALGADYKVDLGSYGKLTPHVDYRYQSRTYYTAFNLPLEQQAPYGLLGARITFADHSDHFTLAVYAQNLTDEKYYTFGQNALATQGVAYEYLGRPREFGVTAGFKF